MRGPQRRRVKENWKIGAENFSGDMYHTPQTRTSVVPALTADQFAGPGEAHAGYGEYNQRHLLNRWADYLERPVQKAAQVDGTGVPVEFPPERLCSAASRAGPRNAATAEAGG